MLRLTVEPVGNPLPTMKVTHADVAEFMLKQLTDNPELRQAAILSN